MKQELKKNIDSLMAQGATYVDARWYPVEESNSLLMWNGNLKDATRLPRTGWGCGCCIAAPGDFPPRPAWKTRRRDFLESAG